MGNNKFGKLKLLWMFLLCISTVTAQYVVTGGEKTPLLALDNTNYRVKIFLVYGMNKVEISYTSPSTSHRWYRYKTKVDDLNPEPVASTQSGTTSTVSNVEDGYGYYVDENGAMRYYVWIMDYSKYAFDIRSLNVSSVADPCVAIRLEGDADMPDMIYYTPTGLPMELEREFEISFGTLLWDASAKIFRTEKYVNKDVNEPFATSFPPPLTDTEITLKGDAFAEYFGVGKTAVTPLYQTKAIEIHADTTILNMGKTSTASDDVMSAPVEIVFRAYTNVPVAALFNWKVFKDEGENPVINYNSDEFVYIFDRVGNYKATLEVSDRTGTCYSDENQFEIVITETVMEIPNAFSPGCTPGINDIFRVRYESVVKFQGWIFNRWGNQLFHWTDPSQGWDGMYNGKYVAAGAYYYVIEYQGTDGKNHVRKGDINVFRGRKIDLEPKKEE
ncbi:MAG: gliding motility-associated C-terminal domain-containing protein [Tannerella sp.]|jgi:gliding motility-associated-like protein|nr:gliding motility-associated C-terminal domain-containing protein [Tannerella sp.]